MPSQRAYRQNITDDERDAVFAALQWQPNEKTDIYFDTQYSDRTFTEVRNDLVFAEQRRVNPEGLISTPDGAVQYFENDGRIETHSMYQERLEEYTGVGLGIATYDVQRPAAAFNRRRVFRNQPPRAHPWDASAVGAGRYLPQPDASRHGST